MRDQFQKSGSAGLKQAADPDRRDGLGQAVGADLGGDGAERRRALAPARSGRKGSWS